MGPVLEKIAGKGIDAGLEFDLNRDFPPGDATFQAIEAACMQAIEQGWMCAHGSDGRRFGRVVEPAPETHNLSVDVVDITDFVSLGEENVIDYDACRVVGNNCVTPPICQGDGYCPEIAMSSYLIISY